MYAITVQQPWAYAIMHMGKNVENRTRIGTWRRAMGETVAVHAGKRWSVRGAQMVPELAGRGWQQGWFDEHVFTRMPAGAIIGTVDVVDVHHDQQSPTCPLACARWGESSYLDADGRTRIDIAHLVLDNPRPLEQPIDCKGALGLWVVPDDIADLLTPAEV